MIFPRTQRAAALGQADDFHQICRQILVVQSGGANMAFAQSYARAGLRMTDAEEIHSQALYIAANLGGWRGPEARDAKLRLKQF